MAPIRPATAATTLLSLGSAVVGVVLLSELPGTGGLLPGPSGVALALAVVALVVALASAELGQVDVEVRQQSYAVSLVGMPLVLGLLYLPAPWVVGARLVAALVASRVQRSGPVRTMHSTAAQLFDVALVLTVVHTWATPGADLTGRTALVTYLAVTTVDVLITTLALVAARADVGPLTLEHLRESVGPACVTVTAATALGLLCAVLLQAGVVGVVLIGIVACGIAVAYRGYLVLRRRHSDLRRVQGFMDSGGVGGGRGAVAADLVDGIRALLRADTVRLVWSSRDGERQSHVSTDDPAARAHHVPPPPGTHGLVPATSDDPALRSWLGAVAAREALVVDLADKGGNGLLVVTDRLGGEARRFTADDASLAAALAAHLVVRLRNTELVDRLRWEATHDGLTGLPNRTVLLASLELHLPPPHPSTQTRTTEAPAHGAAVFVLGLDNLHEVNDTLGHAVGDELLVEVAHRLTRLQLPGAAVAHLSGGFFAVTLPAVRGGDFLSVAHRLRTVAEEPVTVRGAVVSVGLRVGAAPASPGADAAELLRRADTALASARSEGRPVAAYEPTMDRGRAERLALLGDLHRALEDRSLTVHFQPKLDMVRGRVSGVEALVRWQHPVLGPISPAVFVPLAESAGLVDRLTDFVLAEALHQAATWHATGLDLRVAVNLSPRSLDDSRLTARVSQALAVAGVPAERLVLEITETSVMGSPERTLPVLQGLAGLGVELSLDDFGTGYSSLAYLQRLPVHELKIDRCFVMALEDPSDVGAVALVRTVLALASGLGLRVVAEGVESARAMAVLRNLGCGHVQGFLISRPVPADDVASTVRGIETDTTCPTGLPVQRGTPTVPS